jgi:hypothetical protein
MHMKATAKRLNTAAVSTDLTVAEKKASKMTPKPTDKVMANGYGGYREYMEKVPVETRERLKITPRSYFGASELQLLINGKNTILDIKNMLDAQNERRMDLQDILNYVEFLKIAGLVEL